MGMVSVLAAVLVALPVAAAAQSGDEGRLVSYRTIDKAEIENLQRWVTAGHEEWCKDARLVAAEELRRVAAQFDGDASELSASEGRGAKQMTFEWATVDGRVLYRVTVERFGWLMPIAGDAEGIVWVPTVVEAWPRRSDSDQNGEKISSEAKATSFAAIRAAGQAHGQAG